MVLVISDAILLFAGAAFAKHTAAFAQQSGQGDEVKSGGTREALAGARDVSTSEGAAPSCSELPDEVVGSRGRFEKIQLGGQDGKTIYVAGARHRSVRLRLIRCLHYQRSSTL
jgi:hypothetical protein